MWKEICLAVFPQPGFETDHLLRGLVERVKLKANLSLSHCLVSSSCCLALSGSRLNWRANRRTLGPPRASHTLQFPRALARVHRDCPVGNRKWEGSQYGGEGSQGIFLSFRAAKVTQG